MGSNGRIKPTVKMQRMVQGNRSVGVRMPEIRIPWNVRARILTDRKHHGMPVSEIDWRSLERNKYAPWGCGAFSGRVTV